MARSTASSRKASAATRNPASRSSQPIGTPASRRAHGSEKTVPIDTLIERRYSGSANSGATSIPSQPRPAAFRMMAPTLV